MRLLFVYIHNFGNIKQQGFNLSSDYDIKFTSDVDKDFNGTSNLTINKIEHNLPHLFHQRIVDIKGIVGENGAGKTTFFKFLAFECHQHLVSFGFDSEFTANVLVYENETISGDKIIKIHIGKKWIISNPTITNTSDTLCDSHLYFDENFYWSELQDFYNTAFIHYSNVFDTRSEEEYNGLYNISTNYLVHRDKISYSNTSFEISEVNAHQLMEMMRQVIFAISFKNNIPFKLPDTIKIYINPNSLKNIDSFFRLANISVKENALLSDLYSTWKTISNDKFIFSNRNDSEYALKLIQRSFFYYFIDKYILHISETILTNFPRIRDASIEVFSFLIDEYEKNKGLIDLDNLILFCENVDKSLTVNINDSEGRKLILSIGDSSFADYLSLFKTFFNDFSKYGSEAFVISNLEIRVPVNDNTLQLLNDYLKTVHITHYFDFYFDGLSSGEQGFLTTFSRFFSLVSYLPFVGSRIEDFKNNLIILIDEGDLYFHPKWQSQYLKFINDILPKIFKNQSIQIIITSHSQFIASDLPKNHLLFLRKETDEHITFKDGTKALGTCKVVDGPELTFAANIHSLLSNTFFLEGAHIGEFAKDVISKVLDQFAGVELTPKFSDDEILAIINNIGEHWLKNHLLEKFEHFKIRSN
jgi:predicted ATPase